MESKITIDDFKKVEMKVGKILSAEKIEGSDKLLKLMVDFAEPEARQILSGIQKYFPDESVLVGRKCVFVTNLEPRMMMGLESNGMLVAVGGGEKPFSMLIPDDVIEVGTSVN